jgi:hypothetical protein
MSGRSSSLSWQLADLQIPRHQAKNKVDLTIEVGAASVEIA